MHGMFLFMKMYLLISVISTFFYPLSRNVAREMSIMGFA